MKTKFKNVAHFYLGCDVEHDALGIGVLHSVYHNGDSPVVIFDEKNYHELGFDQIKPILKPITDITFELFKEFAEEADSDEVLFHSASKTVDHMELSKYMETQSKWIAFLCSRGYNVFDLDESEIITKQ